MEQKIKETGVLYEKLMMRAHQLDAPSVTMGADRRIYYLLYYIKIGLDLRQTGYPAQFNLVKSNVTTALERMLKQELHKEERVALRRLLKTLGEVWSESELERWLKRALISTSRFSEQMEDVFA